MSETVFVICAREGEMGPSPWDDDVRAKCELCGAAITHRPHIPRPSTLVCLACCVQQLEEQEEDANVEVRISEETIKELKELSAPWEDPNSEPTREGRG